MLTIYFKDNGPAIADGNIEQTVIDLINILSVTPLNHTNITVTNMAMIHRIRLAVVNQDIPTPVTIIWPNGNKEKISKYGAFTGAGYVTATYVDNILVDILKAAINIRKQERA